MYKYNNGMLPNLFDDFLKSNSDTHHYNTRNALKLRPPLVKTSLATKFIKKTGVDLWNSLEGNMDVNRKIGSFKKHLKIFLTKDY